MTIQVPIKTLAMNPMTLRGEHIGLPKPGTTQIGPNRLVWSGSQMNQSSSRFHKNGTNECRFNSQFPWGVNDTGPMNWIDSFSLKIYILIFF